MWGARTQERKNSRNSITKVVSLSISKVILLLVLEIQEDMGRSGDGTGKLPWNV